MWLLVTYSSSYEDMDPIFKQEAANKAGQLCISMAGESQGHGLTNILTLHTSKVVP